MFRPVFLVPLAIACSSSPQRERVRTCRVDPARLERVERGLLPAVTVVGEELRYSIDQRMAELEIPAISIAVFDNYELQWAKAYGLADVEGNALATTETTFLAGSISKSVNALAALLAVADGSLSLDAPINDALTSWKLPDNELTSAKPVTLRMLLSHTAGLNVHGFPGYGADMQAPTLHQILDGVPPANTPAIRVVEAPGIRYRYSGGGTMISQLALIERSKQPYAELLAARVLEPLGMERSSFDQQLTPERLRHAAVGYGGDGRAIAGKRNAYPEMAAAGLWTTPTDLATFFLEIARARAERPSRVPRAVAEQMTTEVIESSGEGIGLGVFLHQRNGVPFFGHSGADAGFQANALVSLDGGYGVVIMSNSENGFLIVPEIERALFAAYEWPGADKPMARVALADEHRTVLLGAFQTENEPFEIFDRDGALQLRLPFEPRPIELVPIAPDVVVRRDGAAWIRIGALGPIQLEHARGPALPIVRSARRHHLFEIEAGNFDAAVAALRESIESKPHEEWILNSIGYRLLPRDVSKAIDVLRLAATVLPDSSNAHDSLGEAYMIAEDTARAIAAYEAALATLDADGRIPADAKPTRRAHAEAQLARLHAADAP
jgi:CubicO group peptidase (beta-lactamase class C family)